MQTAWYINWLICELLSGLVLCLSEEAFDIKPFLWVTKLNIILYFFYSFMHSLPPSVFIWYYVYDCPFTVFKLIIENYWKKYTSTVSLQLLLSCWYWYCLYCTFCKFSMSDNVCFVKTLLSRFILDNIFFFFEFTFSLSCTCAHLRLGVHTFYLLNDLL